MFRVDRVWIDNKKFFTYNISLPKTRLLIIANDEGYFSNRLIDVEIFNSLSHLRERKVICGNVSDKVKSIEELLHSPISNLTNDAKEIGINKGMLVIDALKKI